MSKKLILKIKYMYTYCSFEPKSHLLKQVSTNLKVSLCSVKCSTEIDNT